MFECWKKITNINALLLYMCILHTILKLCIFLFVICFIYFICLLMFFFKINLFSKKSLYANISNINRFIKKAKRWYDFLIGEHNWLIIAIKGVNVSECDKWINEFDLLVIANALCHHNLFFFWCFSFKIPVWKPVK